MNEERENETIWEKQAKLKEWWENSGYRQAYPGSRFYTGRDLAEAGTLHGRPTWDELTPEQQERREEIAYSLNTKIFSMGINLSGAFQEGGENEANT